MARMPFAQALIILAEAPVVHSARMDMSSSGTVTLCHLAKPDLAAVWLLIEVMVAVLELVWASEECPSSGIETRSLVAEALVEVRLLARLENAEVVAP